MTGEAAIRINENSVIRESIYGKRIRSTDVILTGIIYGCASLSMLLLIGILGYTFVRGVPHVTWSFLSTVSSATKGTFGILGNIINTLYTKITLYFFFKFLCMYCIWLFLFNINPSYTSHCGASISFICLYALTFICT